MFNLVFDISCIEKQLHRLFKKQCTPVIKPEHEFVVQQDYAVEARCHLNAIFPHG